MQPIHIHVHLDPITETILHEEWDRIKDAQATSIDKELGRCTRVADQPAPGVAPGVAPELAPCELSAVVTVLPGLIRLVNECSDRPVSKFRPTVTRLIREQQFVDVAGDSIVEPHISVRIEQYVELTVRVLKRVREQGHEQGISQDTPMTPQMFG